jgi:hypothetical protein
MTGFDPHGPPASRCGCACSNGSYILAHDRVSQEETALHNAVLFVVTLSFFHDTMRSHNRVKPEKSPFVTL